MGYQSGGQQVPPPQKFLEAKKHFEIFQTSSRFFQLAKLWAISPAVKLWTGSKFKKKKNNLSWGIYARHKT